MNSLRLPHCATLACALALPVLLTGTAAFAAPVTLPHVFQPDTPAKAAEVNDDLNTLRDAVNALQTTVAAQQVTITALQSQLSSMGNVAALNNVVKLVQVSHTDGAGNTNVYPTVQFHGVNVQILNGMGYTLDTNGLGNLIIGYNDSRPGNETEFCSIGGYNSDKVTCKGNDGVWASDQRSGSHNLILGDNNAYSQSGGIVAGFDNITNGAYASITGGGHNTASGTGSSVGGGERNTASGYESTVAGGDLNVASGYNSTVAGGAGNHATDQYTTVNGGDDNTASGYAAAVSGGSDNTAANLRATVCGGFNGSTTADYQVVCP